MTPIQKLTKAMQLWTYLDNNKSKSTKKIAEHFVMDENDMKKLRILHGVGAKDSFLQAYECIA